MIDDTTLMIARSALLAELRADVSDERVLNAIAGVPREQFVPAGLRAQAYENRPLPIGEGQTISQPTIVAAMTEALQLTGAEKVLEIGAGSGYQAAVLSLLAREVVTVERLESLAESARKRLHLLDYKNVRVYQAGEHLGYPPEAPYDAIIVTAASPVVPQELVQQLALGGRMIIPVGGRDLQELLLVRRAKRGLHIEKKGACRFVPLIGPGAWIVGDTGWRGE